MQIENPVRFDADPIKGLLSGTRIGRSTAWACRSGMLLDLFGPKPGQRLWSDLSDISDQQRKEKKETRGPDDGKDWQASGVHIPLILSARVKLRTCSAGLARLELDT